MRYASEFSEYVPAVATGVAGHEDGSIALANRKRWGPVGMAGATAHGDITGPCAFQSADEVTECG